MNFLENVIKKLFWTFPKLCHNSKADWKIVVKKTSNTYEWVLKTNFVLSRITFASHYNLSAFHFYKTTKSTTFRNITLVQKHAGFLLLKKPKKA